MKNSIKIVIDDSLSNIKGSAGIGHYSNVLYQGIKEYFRNYQNVKVLFKKYSFISLYPKYIRRFLHLFFITYIDRIKNYDVVHFTNYYVPLIKLGHTKYVVTIHDMRAWLYPNGLSKFYLNFIKYMIKKAVLTANLIITQSQTSKQDICNITNTPENKVYVCYNPLRSIWKPIKNYPKGEYLLFVSSIDIHKNLSTLIKAFVRLKKDPKYKHMKLIIVGKKRGGYRELNNSIKENFLEDDVSILGYVSDEKLLQLYNGAEALVMPSLYEGFGIPIIEAMACGIPVIASDIPVFKEIAQDAALFYGAPKSDTLLLTALKKILSNVDVKNNLLLKSKRILQLYSKENFIKKHIEVYKRVMTNKEWDLEKKCAASELVEL